MDRGALETNVDVTAKKAAYILRSRSSTWVLASISFAESALPLPIVTDPFLSAYILADRRRTSLAIIITTIASVIGGLFAYLLAVSFYDLVTSMYAISSFNQEFLYITDQFRQGTFVITVVGAVTPIPYTFVAIAAGFTKSSFIVFLTASVVGRLFRYGVVGWLTYRYGERALVIARRHLFKVTVLLLVSAVGYFYFHT